MRDLITADEMKQLLHYEPTTGVFTWVTRRNRVTFGKVAACPATNPVRTIMINGRAYSVLQLAWLYSHGAFPRSRIITLNGNSHDARLDNLVERAAKNEALTAERLRGLLDYDQQNGAFIRKLRTSNRISEGDVAGTPNVDGYLIIRVDGKKYPAHRLAWLYTYGAFPQGEIDHINGVRHDNRIANLRVVSRTGNTQNAHRIRLPNGNFIGVVKRKSGWQARVHVNKRRIVIGTFSTPDEAHKAYIAAKRKHHPTNTL